ncbi:MAG: glycosyl hydrolase [Prosthecobacter sp.]|uniref:glycosyl hydrolase n=1 Tax=Prosthecobacter sp. TaxID=1965333 RepID=UPI0038FE9123
MKANLFLLFISTSAIAGPIQNGSFDNTPANLAQITPWQVNGTTVGLSVTRTASDFTSSPLSLRVAGRGSATDGPVQQQNVLSALTNGATYVTRFKIKSDGQAQIRCLLFVASSIAQTPILMAETVVRSDGVGQWINVEGSAPVTWTGTPSAARMYFAVEQLYPGTAPVSAFPSYNLDDIFMELDNDGDGLSNAEETTTNPNAKDTDLDTLPDKWELANGFNPNSDTDSALDADNDGHSNKIEYWACTNPLSAASYPGLTSDPQASTATKALLYYLQTRGARGNGRYLTGHHAQDIANGDYTNYVVGLNTLMTQAGHPSWVTILSIAAEGPSAAQPLQIATSGPVLRSYMDAGGLGIIHFTPRNPWTNNFNGDKTGVDIADLLTPGTVANLRMIGWMDAIAVEIALNGPDRPVIFRPFSEQNGNWNWYGRLQQSEFVAMYRWLRDYFVITKGLHNIIWTLEGHIGVHRPAGTGNAGAAMDYYYPGDDALDLIGFSAYISGWNPGFDADAQSRLHPKAFAITEGGPPPNEDDVPNTYNSTYLPALDIWYPRAAFFVIWNSWVTGPFVAIKDNANYVELLTDTRVTNREQLNYLNTTAYWQAANGLMNQKLTDDADHDGLANVLEAAMGTNPLMVNTAAMPMQSFVTVSGLNYSALTFTRDPAIADLMPVVEWSNDLLNWSAAATTEFTRVLSGGLETITVRSNVPVGAGQQFLRMKVDAP